MGSSKLAPPGAVKPSRGNRIKKGARHTRSVGYSVSSQARVLQKPLCLRYEFPTSADSMLSLENHIKLLSNLLSCCEQTDAQVACCPSSVTGGSQHQFLAAWCCSRPVIGVSCIPGQQGALVAAATTSVAQVYSIASLWANDETAQRSVRDRIKPANRLAVSAAATTTGSRNNGSTTIAAADEAPGSTLMGAVNRQACFKFEHHDEPAKHLLAYRLYKAERRLSKYGQQHAARNSHSQMMHHLPPPPPPPLQTINCTTLTNNTTSTSSAIKTISTMASTKRIANQGPESLEINLASPKCLATVEITFPSDIMAGKKCYDNKRQPQQQQHLLVSRMHWLNSVSKNAHDR
ncbi:unnamed protein product [Protopolystoma xenopodis]|uniref:Uncharacterized protein n=1 Tax=Protopolystoma xenopodis TaxID=117903 RepID=A0A448WPH5_9PLAT|nr:unnamed protein product [Protopolystoma xenopodis]